MATPTEILDNAFQRAAANLNTPIISDPQAVAQIEYVTRLEGNRTGSRVLLACALAKTHKPNLDIRKPYEEIGGGDAYSGRTYDESYVTAFINTHKLPCNSTTAFLTPALRAKNITLTPELKLGGRPAELYKTVLQLLDDVHKNKYSSENLLTEVVRWLLIIRNENQQRLGTLLVALKANQAAGNTALSSEATVKLIEQHLASPQSSRLPELVVAAIYQAAAKYLNENTLPLAAHNAADEQTGALGDLEITLADSTNIVTCYEMKTRTVTIEDIDRAVQKITQSGQRPDNYIFVTTDVISVQIQEYAAKLYKQTGGIEISVLDCIGLLRHFLHLFHRLRVQFLDAYQALVIVEPESGVRQSLKETFLTLRRAAETADAELDEQTSE